MEHGGSEETGCDEGQRGNSHAQGGGGDGVDPRRQDGAHDDERDGLAESGKKTQSDPCGQSAPDLFEAVAWPRVRSVNDGEKDAGCDQGASDGRSCRQEFVQEEESQDSRERGVGGEENGGAAGAEPLDRRVKATVPNEDAHHGRR